MATSVRDREKPTQKQREREREREGGGGPSRSEWKTGLMASKGTIHTYYELFAGEFETFTYTQKTNKQFKMSDR